MRAVSIIGGLAALALASAGVAQDLSRFTDGPVISGYGRVIPVDSDLPLPKRAVFKVLLDGNVAARPGEANRALDSAARFLNMHVAAGIPERNIRIAVVIHGPASGDLTGDAFYAPRHEGKANANAALVRQLVAHGVQIYLCGQSAEAFGIARGDLLPGVKLSLSAMTARAVLAQQGYVQVQ